MTFTTRKDHRAEIKELDKLSVPLMQRARDERNAFGKTTRPYEAASVKSKKLVFRITEVNFVTRAKQSARLLVVKADNEEDLGKECDLNFNSALFEVLKKCVGTQSGLLVEGAYIGMNIEQRYSGAATEQKVIWIINEEKRWP